MQCSCTHCAHTFTPKVVHSRRDDAATLLDGTGPRFGGRRFVHVEHELLCFSLAMLQAMYNARVAKMREERIHHDAWRDSTVFERAITPVRSCVLGCAVFGRFCRE